MLTEPEVGLLAAQGDPAAALAAARRVLAVEGSRTFRLERWLWPLLATTAEATCRAMARRPG